MKPKTELSVTLLLFLVWLAGMAGIFYVAIHFITKYW